MISKTIGKKYATALFNVARENKNIEIVKDNLTFIKNKIAPNVMRIITIPSIPTEEKKEIINKLLENKVDISVKNFLNVLIDKKKFDLFDDIYNAFIDLYQNYSNIVVGEVISSTALEESYKIKIKNILEKKYKKTFVLDFKIDEDLIGGIIIRIGNEIIDGSLKNQLIKIKNILLG
jgi:F-type H+-transporting ATPase subunit delta